MVNRIFCGLCILFLLYNMIHHKSVPIVVGEVEEIATPTPDDLQADYYEYHNYKVAACWLTIHTSADGLDDRKYVKIKGEILKSGAISFANEFERLKIDTAYNDPLQHVNQNECSYVE